MEWNPANVVHCSARQRRILSEAERLLAPGGLLIYSTCTYSDEENMHQVRWMSEQYSLTSVRVPVNDDWNITTLANEHGTGYQFYPHKVRGEGFFCAVMKKSGDGRSYDPSKSGSREHNSIIAEINPPKSLVNWIKPDDGNGSYRFSESIDKEIYVLQSSIDHDWLSYGIVRYPGTEVGYIKGELGSRHRSLTFSSHPPKLSAGGPSHRIRRSGAKEDDLIASSEAERPRAAHSFSGGARRTFSPSHPLALSQCLNAEIPSIELDLEQAIRYLRKDSISAESDVPGWNVARYRGFALGWLKQTQAGLKNYLPTKYRIVKQQVR
jgi:hypothetical protein